MWLNPVQPMGSTSGYRTPAEVFHGEPVEEELKERRCPDQRDLVSYEGVQESHLIVA